mgnify:CR=1 FL=1
MYYYVLEWLYVDDTRTAPLAHERAFDDAAFQGMARGAQLQAMRDGWVLGSPRPGGCRGELEVTVEYLARLYGFITTPRATYAQLAFLYHPSWKGIEERPSWVPEDLAQRVEAVWRREQEQGAEGTDAGKEREEGPSGGGAVP